MIRGWILLFIFVFSLLVLKFNHNASEANKWEDQKIEEELNKLNKL